MILCNAIATEDSEVTENYWAKRFLWMLLSNFLYNSMFSVHSVANNYWNKVRHELGLFFLQTWDFGQNRKI